MNYLSRGYLRKINIIKLNYLGGEKKGFSELNYCSRKKHTLQFTFIKTMKILVLSSNIDLWFF